MTARRSTKTESLPPQSERSFQDQVLALAKTLGWRTYHTWISVHSAGGFPDLVLVRRPRVIFVELKSERGTLTDAQRDWLDALAGCTVESYVWRPSDWPSVETLLR